MKKKPIIISTLLLSLICAGAAIAWWKWPRLPSITAPTDDLIAWRATDSWAKLPSDQRQKYTEELMKRPFGDLLASVEKLPEDKQRLVVADALRDNPMTRTMDEYFRTPAGPQRTKLIDDFIDKSEARRREMEKRNGGKPTTQPLAANPAKWMKMITENTPPGRFIQMMEFRAAVRLREGERGIKR